MTDSEIHIGAEIAMSKVNAVIDKKIMRYHYFNKSYFAMIKAINAVNDLKQDLTRTFSL